MATNLLIPGKNALGASYQKDMQTLEIFARQPIQQLIAGVGIVLDPASGLATDSSGNGPHPVTISAETTLYHVVMGYELTTIPGLGFTGWGGECSVAGTDAAVVQFTLGPIKGSVLVEATNVNINPSPTGASPSATLVGGTIYVSDATQTNTLLLQNAGASLPVFGGTYTGWVQSHADGSDLMLGTPQNTHLIESASGSIPYWLNALFSLTVNGLEPT